VVLLTSSAATRLKPKRGAYAISKAVLEALAKTYALETQEGGVRVNLVDPGAVDTMRASAVPGEDRMTLTQPASLGPLIVRLCHPTLEMTGQTIEFRKAPFDVGGARTHSDATPKACIG
jgi:NAD(P)-dependent dehydrogenase (short-subunit alcohol dehydrogenase family)